jgi:glycosyltransferase involved in cell wall biosynthesis
MIVKDEEASLGRCLDSVASLVDEIILVDTGSADRTRDIAASYGARVIEHPWRGDFSEARNVSLEQATGQWILYLDADEALSEGQEQLREVLQTDPGHMGFFLPLINFVGEQAEQDAVTSPAFRIFRNDPRYRFQRALHEQILTTVLDVTPGAQVGFLPVLIEHFGYLRALVLGRDKVQRNLSIAKEEVRRYPREGFVWYNLAQEYMRLTQWKKALYCYRRAFMYTGNLTSGFVPSLVKNIVLALLNLRQFEEALQVVREAQAAYPDYTDLWFYEGITHLENRHLDEARRCFETCCEMGDPPGHFYITDGGVGSYKALFWRGECEQRRGRLAEAAAAYRASLRQVVAQRRYYDAPVQALVQLYQGRGLEGAVIYQELQGILPLETDLVWRRSVAWRFYQAGEIAWAERLAATLPDPDEETWLMLAQARLGLGGLAEAAGTLEELLAAHPHQLLAVLQLSLVRALQGEFQAARDLLRAFSWEGDAQYFLWLHESLFALWSGEDRPALRPPVSEEVRAALQTYLLDLFRLTLQIQAFEHFEVALPLLDDLGLAGGERHRALGQLYYDLHFDQSSLEELLRAVQCGAAEAETYKMLGLLCVRQQRYPEAEVFLREALRQQPDGPQAEALLMALATALLLQGKSQEAAPLLNCVAALTGGL